MREGERERGGREGGTGGEGREPIPGALPPRTSLKPSPLLKGPPSDIITWGIKASACELGDTHTHSFSPQQHPWFRPWAFCTHNSPFLTSVATPHSFIPLLALITPIFPLVEQEAFKPTPICRTLGFAQSAGLCEQFGFYPNWSNYRQI